MPLTFPRLSVVVDARVFFKNTNAVVCDLATLVAQAVRVVRGDTPVS